MERQAMIDEHTLHNLLLYMRDMWEQDHKRFQDCYYLISQLRHELMRITEHFEDRDEHPEWLTEWLNETECKNLIKESLNWMREYSKYCYRPKQITIDVNNL